MLVTKCVGDNYETDVTNITVTASVAAMVNLVNEVISFHGETRPEWGGASRRIWLCFCTFNFFWFIGFFVAFSFGHLLFCPCFSDLNKWNIFCFSLQFLKIELENIFGSNYINLKSLISVGGVLSLFIGTWRHCSKAPSVGNFFLWKNCFRQKEQNSGTLPPTPIPW